MVGSPREWREVGGLQFSQASVSTVFSDNRHVLGLVREWMENRDKLEKGEVQLAVVQIEGEMVTVNNRRLFAAKVLKSIVGGDVWIPVRQVTNERQKREIRRRLEEQRFWNMEQGKIVAKTKRKGSPEDRAIR